VLDPACVDVVTDDLGPPVFVLVDKAPPIKVFVEAQAVVNDSFAPESADEFCGLIEVDPPEFVATALAAKKLVYNAFQADTEVRILEGIGAIVACTLEQLELSIEAAAMYRGSVKLNASPHQSHLYIYAVSIYLIFLFIVLQ
jgi:hypothetical protein